MNATPSWITVVSSAGTQTAKRDRMLCACLMTVGGAPIVGGADGRPSRFVYSQLCPASTERVEVPLEVMR